MRKGPQPGSREYEQLFRTLMEEEYLREGLDTYVAGLLGYWVAELSTCDQATSVTKQPSNFHLCNTASGSGACTGRRKLPVSSSS